VRIAGAGGKIAPVTRYKRINESNFDTRKAPEIGASGR
jgi:hypothetical protein